MEIRVISGKNLLRLFSKIQIRADVMMTSCIYFVRFVMGLGKIQ